MMRVLLVCLFVMNHVVVQSGQEISGDILARELNKVADSVGWSFLQVQILLRIQVNQVIAINKKWCKWLCFMFIFYSSFLSIYLIFMFFLSVSYLVHVPSVYMFDHKQWFAICCYVPTEEVQQSEVPGGEDWWTESCQRGTDIYTNQTPKYSHLKKRNINIKFKSVKSRLNT